MQLSGQWAYFDLDGTLIEWVQENHPRVESGGWLPLDLDSGYVFFPCLGNIRKLSELKSRGSVIVVWSQSDLSWTETVLRGLGIRGLVDFVLVKPHMVVDDLEPVNWLPGVEFFGDS